MDQMDMKEYSERHEHKRIFCLQKWHTTSSGSLAYVITELIWYWLGRRSSRCFFNVDLTIRVANLALKFDTSYTRHQSSCYRLVRDTDPEKRLTIRLAFVLDLGFEIISQEVTRWIVSCDCPAVKDHDERYHVQHWLGSTRSATADRMDEVSSL
nr:hypothetical protein CFP56_52134 [Quercus suber]